MKITGNVYEFDVVLLGRMSMGIDNISEEEFDAIPIADGGMERDQISVHYHSRRFGGSAHIIGYFYEDEKKFTGKVHYKLADVLPCISDVKGILIKTKSSIFIYGKEEYDDDTYGYAIYLNSF